MGIGKTLRVSYKSPDLRASWREELVLLGYKAEMSPFLVGQLDEMFCCEGA